MIEYLEDENVICGKIYRHENSGSDKANRIWVYRNDLGEEYMAGDKYSCQRKASQDLRACRLDLVVEYTAVGGIHKFEFSDTFQNQNMNDLLQKIRQTRGEVRNLEEVLEIVRAERDYFRDKLKIIAQCISEEAELVQRYIKEGPYGY
jgi:hypothetical protein